MSKSKRAHANPAGAQRKSTDTVLKLVGTKSYRSVKARASQLTELQRAGAVYGVSAKVDPRLLGSLGNTRLYFLLVDPAWARAKKHVEKFIQSYAAPTTVYRVLGDADFASLIATDKDGIERFCNDLEAYVQSQLRGSEPPIAN